MAVTLEELAQRLDDSALTILDVRSASEYGGAGYGCCARQGHIPGARSLDLQALLGVSPARVRELVGLPAGAEIVTYCHSGSRSGVAAEVLRAAGYDASNYRGSWHEWAAHAELPAEQ